MRGKAVFYPIGWDDNGLPTERRVQNYFHVRCDPTLPYDPSFVPPGRPDGDPVAISRRNFVALCQRLADLDEQAFEQVWRRLGLSVDWSTQYQTIDDNARAVSQRGFLRNLARGEAYLAEAPTLWDVTFQTSPASTTGWLSGGPMAPVCRWPPPGPNCCPPAWRWSPTRTTSGTPRWPARQSSRRCSVPGCRC
jgi:valyl-tRNA synthetase